MMEQSGILIISIGKVSSEHENKSILKPKFQTLGWIPRLHTTRVSKYQDYIPGVAIFQSLPSSSRMRGTNGHY